jgi:hypothetical protein
MDDVSTSAPEQVSVVRRVETQRVSEVRSFLTREPEQLTDGEKPRRRRPRAPRPISGPDEVALSWFFGQGLSIYEKSTFGPIVQKIAMDGYASTTCGTCDGAGIIDEGGGVTLDDKCRGCSGSGREPHKAGREQRWCLTCGGLGREPPYEVEVKMGGWCPSCRGTGSGCVERKSVRRARCVWCRPDPYVASTDERTGEVTKALMITAWVPRHCCPNCLGVGDAPITAKPVAKGDEAGGVIGNDTALTRFAITSRRADAVKAISPALHAALEAFYGDMGSRWALTQFGRLFALSHLTPAGKTLARIGIQTGAPKAKKKGKKAKGKATKKKPTADVVEAVLLSAQERIGVQANVEQTQPKHEGERRKLLDAARAQAADLYARAAMAWNSVSVPKGELQKAKEFDERLTRLGHGNVAKMVRQAGAR